MIKKIIFRLLVLAGILFMNIAWSHYMGRAEDKTFIDVIVVTFLAGIFVVYLTIKEDRKKDDKLPDSKQDKIG